MKAIGLIETNGLVAAIHSADSMLKSANVELVAKHSIGSGLITIIIAGDVGAVNSAVDTGIMAATDMNGLVSAHVIARPDDETNKILLPDPPDSPKQKPSGGSDKGPHTPKLSPSPPKAVEKPAVEPRPVAPEPEKPVSKSKPAPAKTVEKPGMYKAEVMLEPEKRITKASLAVQAARMPVKATRKELQGLTVDELRRIASRQTVNAMLAIEVRKLKKPALIKTFLERGWTIN